MLTGAVRASNVLLLSLLGGEKAGICCVWRIVGPVLRNSESLFAHIPLDPTVDCG